MDKKKSANTLLRTGEAAAYMHVSTQSVRMYVRSGRLPVAETTPGGQRLFSTSDLDAFLGRSPVEQERVMAFYIRSSSGQDATLHSQDEALRGEYGSPAFVFKDRCSGLRENRPGLSRALDHAKKGEFTHLAVTNKDRLTRFGFAYLERMFAEYGVDVIVLNADESKDLHEELMEDFMSLIAVFSGRFYRLRGWEQRRRLLDDARARLPEGGDDDG